MIEFYFYFMIIIIQKQFGKIARDKHASVVRVMLMWRVELEKEPLTFSFILFYSEKTFFILVFIVCLFICLWESC